MLQQRRLCWILTFLSYCCYCCCLHLASAIAVQEAYQQARCVRTTQGHEAAQPLYQKLRTQQDDSSEPMDRTAALRIAASQDTKHRQDVIEAVADKLDSDVRQDVRQLQNLLLQHRYTAKQIAHMVLGSEEEVRRRLHIADDNDNDNQYPPPLYLQPLAAGSRCPPVRAISSGLHCLIEMFCMALCVPQSIFLRHFTVGELRCLQRLGVAFVDEDWIVPYLHITPMPHERYVLTDLHPRCLSMTTVGTQNHGAVMYVGPDSVALQQHGDAVLSFQTQRYTNIVDIGTGSGVQALMAAWQSDGETSKQEQQQHITCVDINPRALAFARCNFQLNNMPHLPRCVLGDVRKDREKWDELLQPNTVDLLLANPPFLPVPQQADGAIDQRYGLFSSGGGSGEVVLEAIVQLAGQCLKRDGAVGIVSEFMNPGPILLDKLKTWWSRHSPTPCGGILFTNEHPIDADTYSQRRADDAQEFATWKAHLEHEGIDEVSPGLLFLRPMQGELDHILVPKTQQGSIWTPANREAANFTKRVAATKFRTEFTERS